MQRSGSVHLRVRVYGTNFHSKVSISRIIPLLGGARGGFFVLLTKILCGNIRLIPVTHPCTPPEEGNFEQEHEVCVCAFRGLRWSQWNSVQKNLNGEPEMRRSGIRIPVNSSTWRPCLSLRRSARSAGAFLPLIPQMYAEHAYWRHFAARRRVCHYR